MSVPENSCQRLVNGGLPDPSSPEQKAQYLLDWVLSVTESLECTALEIALTGVCEAPCADAIHVPELVTIEECRACLVDNVTGCLFPDTVDCLECFIDRGYPFKPDTNDGGLVDSILSTCFGIQTSASTELTTTQVVLLTVFSLMILVVSGLLVWVAMPTSSSGAQ